jgi:pimeloyl-ACP methyl ester carboxylesterase
MDKARFPLSLPGSWAILLGSLIRTGQDVSSVDPMQRIDQYQRPVLIIVGGRDIDIGSDDGEELRAAAEASGADAQLEVCPDAGHSASVTACNSRYREWVLGFLARSLAP